MSDLERAKSEKLKKNAIPQHRIGLQMELEEMEPYQRDMLKNTKENEFDLRVEIIDPKTGQLLKYQPYRLQISQSNNGERSEIYYRREHAGAPERAFSASGKLLDGPKETKVK